MLKISEIVPLCILSSPSRCVRQENGHKTAMQGLRNIWKSGGSGEGGQVEIQSLLNEKVLLLFLQKFAPVPTSLQWEICHRLLSYLVTRKERQKKLGNRKKLVSFYFRQKSRTHMTLLSLGVSHKCCYMCIWFGHEKRMSTFFTRNFKLTLTSTSK